MTDIETREAKYQQWLEESAARIAKARESGDDAVVQAALDAYYELANAVLEMEQRSA